VIYPLIIFTMYLNDIKGSFQIEEAEGAVGCSEACAFCGAYPDFSPECLRVRSITRDQLEQNLRRFSSFLALVVTTPPRTEPLQTDVFADLAEIVNVQTDTRSSLVAISHGLRSKNKIMEQRLERIIGLMEEGVIPLFVLSMDFARSRGKIDPQKNLESYMETLMMLQTVLKVARVTVSLQAESPEAMVKVEKMFAEILDRLGWTEEEMALLNVDRRESYTASGRAGVAGGATVANSADCDIIPDAGYYDLVKADWPRTHKLRGMIDMNGRLWAQENRPGKVYGDSVDKSRWEMVDVG